MLSTAAFNALLKNAGRTACPRIFILATTEIQKVPRHHSFPAASGTIFTRIGPEDIARRVEYIQVRKSWSFRRTVRN